MENIPEKNEQNEKPYAQNQPLSILILSNNNIERVQNFIGSLGFMAEVYTIAPEDEEKMFSKTVINQAVNHAKEQGFHLVLTVDPESNKFTLAVRLEPHGKFRILNVHQLAVLIADLLIKSRHVEEEIILKSFRVTEMLNKVCSKNGVKCLEFYPRQLSEALKGLEKENQKALLMVDENLEFSTLEEDSVFKIITLLTERESMLRKSNKTLFDDLIRLYIENGFYKEKVLAINLQQKVQSRHYSKILDLMRKGAPDTLLSDEIKSVTDYKKGTSKNLLSGKTTKLSNLPLNAVTVTLSDGSSINMELTDDKISYSVSVRSNIHSKDQFEEVNKNSKKRILKLIETLNRLS